MAGYAWQGKFSAPIDDLLKSKDAKVLDLG